MDTITIWLKVVHIPAMLMWCAGLFYLPALFAAHPRASRTIHMRRLRTMTRFIYIGVASPAAIIAIVTGTFLIYTAGVSGWWLAIKLALVTGMMLFHVVCGRLLAELAHRPALFPAWAHLSLIAVPAILIPAVFWMVLGKPY